MRISPPRLLAAAAPLLLLAGCLAGFPRRNEAAAAPELRPEIFFAGRTHGEGTLSVRGRAPRALRVDGQGSTEPDGTFRLDQTVTYGDGATERRTFRLRRVDATRYAATLTDAKGEVEGETNGSVFHLRYLLRRPAVYMEQYLYLQPDGHTVLNEATVTALGVPVARLAETITRDAPVTGPAAAPAANAEVYAIRYGTLRNFPVAGLVAGADTTRRMDVALMIWLVRRADGRNVLVDAGFYRDKFMTRWTPADYVKPSEAVRAVGLRPEEVTDVIVSHVHWDHMDGADLFPNARLWIQRDEYTHHVGDDGRSLDRAADSLDAAMLARLAHDGRVQLVDGDGREIMPGITVYTGGRHTFASQYVGVRTPQGTVVLASDNAYLYENLERRVPIAQTLDSASNLRAQARMLTLASSPRLVVPGHDPLVFVRFPKPGHGVARIE
jgi:glyoxylase-like metal-dependent hydrolase (beta-lactamase superfamily II)